MFMVKFTPTQILCNYTHIYIRVEKKICEVKNKRYDMHNHKG